MIIEIHNTNQSQDFRESQYNIDTQNQKMSVNSPSPTVHRLSNINNRIIKIFSKTDISIQYSERLTNNNIESSQSSVLNISSESTENTKSYLQTVNSIIRNATNPYISMYFSATFSHLLKLSQEPNNLAISDSGTNVHIGGANQ